MPTAPRNPRSQIIPADRLAIAVFRYLVLPAVGALLAWLVYRRVDAEALERRLERHAGRCVGIATIVVTAIFCSLLVARYATWHTFVFDLGIYDQKIWSASIQTSPVAMVEQTWRAGVKVSPCGATRYWGVCHFQPLYVVYALLYRIWASPLMLLLTQAILVVSSAIPCYLLARDALQSRAAGALTALLFLLHPAVQFNGLVDFRPDHVAIPALLWAYWLLHRERVLPAVATAAIAALAKESLILAFAGFGAFLAVKRGRWLVGGLVVAVSALVFSLATFWILAGTGRSEGAFMVGRYFSGGAALLAPGLLARKVVYVVALFGPLAFLCWRRPVMLLPAMPSLAISLLSNEVTHVSIQSQYSASVIGPAFAALIAALARSTNGALATNTNGAVRTVRTLCALAALAAVFSIAQGPTPLGINFWNELWGQHWHYRQYLPDREATLTEAAKLIPTDPDIMVVSQNDVNSARLAHRHFYFPFPNGLERADFVLLDARRRPWVYWVPDAERYAALVNVLRKNDDYRLAFDREGVLLFARTSRHDPGAPDLSVAPPLPGGMPR